MDYKTVLKLFKEAGFIDIKTQIKYDIITGWINSDGDIESITINGFKKFDENATLYNQVYYIKFCRRNQYYNISFIKKKQTKIN